MDYRRYLLILLLLALANMVRAQDVEDKNAHTFARFSKHCNATL